jgi:hypothetical protein
MLDVQDHIREGTIDLAGPDRFLGLKEVVDNFSFSSSLVFDTNFVDHDTPYYTPNPGPNCRYNQKYQDNLADTNKEANVVTFAHKSVNESA